MSADRSCPAAILQLDELFFEHFDAVVAAANRFSEIAARLKGICGDSYESVNANVDFSDFVYKDVDEYVKRVRRIASSEFSTPLAPFRADNIAVLPEAIDAIRETYRRSWRTDDSDAFGPVREAIAKCSPMRVWEALAAHFDPDRQFLVAAREHASKLGNELLPHLYRNYGYREHKEDAIKLVKGRAEICLSVYTEASWDGNSRKMRNCGTLMDFAKAMDFALVQAHGDARPRCGHRLRELSDAYWTDRKQLVSRERISLGDGCDVVAGFKQFKLYLTQDVAGTLNMFLAEYGKPREMPD